MSPDSQSGPPTTTSCSLPLGRSVLRGAIDIGMIRAVEDRPGEVIEAGVEQIERVAAHLLDGANLADQISAFGDEVSTWLDFQPELVAEMVFQPLASASHSLKYGVQIDVGLFRFVRDRQPAAGTDGVNGAADIAAPRASIAPQTWPDAPSRCRSRCACAGR